MIENMIAVFRAQYGKDVDLQRVETRLDAYGLSYWAFTTHHSAYRWSDKDGYWWRIA